MNTSASPDTLTVLYDGACPLCRREISHVKGLADRRGDNALCFVDVSNAAGEQRFAAERGPDRLRPGCTSGDDEQLAPLSTSPHILVARSP